VSVTTQTTETAPDPAQLELFFDGECPLCRREVALLRRLDRAGRIAFTDITGLHFDAARYGTTQAALMGRIHARRRDGAWFDGVDVFRELYARVGFGWVVALSRLPVVRQLLDGVYAWFAVNRLRLTGRRCDTQGCALADREPSP
jgi:predicted DCC family thiol-disulfide oxidoreductase YuxK